MLEVHTMDPVRSPSSASLAVAARWTSSFVLIESPSVGLEIVIVGAVFVAYAVSIAAVGLPGPVSFIASGVVCISAP